MLLYKPYFLKDESLGSYIHRLSAANFHFTVTPYAELLNTTVAKLNNNEIDKKSLELLAEYTEVSADRLYSMTMTPVLMELGEHLYNKVVIKNRVKYCPKCISSAAYHKRDWNFHFVSICLEHNVMLIERCPQCNDEIKMSTLMVGRCSSCDYPLNKGKNEEIDTGSGIYKSQEEIQARLNNIRERVSHLTHYSLKEYLILSLHSFYLLEGLNSFIDGVEKIKAFYTTDGGHNVRKSLIAYANVYWMYSNFPSNLNKVITHFNLKGNIKYEQKEQYEKLFRYPIYSDLQEEYSKAWLEQLDKGRIRRDFKIIREERVNQKRQFISKEGLKQKWGVSYPLIERLGEDEKIAINSYNRGKYKRILFGANIEDRIKLHKSYLSKAQVADKLGISKEAVNKLVTAEILKIDDQLSTKKRHLFDRGEINQLLDRTRGALVKDVNGISFYEALIKYSVNGLTINYIIDFLLKGILTSTTTIADGNLKDVYLDENEIRHCLGIIKSEKESEQGYYMKDVIKLFNIGEKAMRNLMDNNVIVADRIITLKDGRKRYLFNKDRIDKLRSEHLFINEAVVEFNITSNTLRRWVKEGKLFDYARGYCKSYLLNKSDLKKLLFKMK